MRSAKSHSKRHKYYLDFYYLDLLTYRPISNEIAEKFSVTHQSPQILVIKNGNAVFNNSHHSISADSLKEGLKN